MITLNYDAIMEDISPTNEEWLHSLDTEQLAEYILNVWLDGALNVNAEFGLNEAQIEQHKGYIVAWLKQPHNKGVANEKHRQNTQAGCIGSGLYDECNR